MPTPTASRVMTANIGAIQVVAIGQIKPSARNAKVHSTKQIRQIADSIAAFGFTNALLVSEDLELIAGYGRYKAAELLGFKEVPVRVVAGLSPTKRRALAIADNKIGQNSKWNRDRLAIEIPELTDALTAEGLDVSVLGFGAVEIDNIIQAGCEKDAGDLWDRIDPAWCATPTISKRGDLWLLGNHKLLCGDPRSAGAIERLMIGRRADMALLDLMAIENVSSPDIGNFLGTTLDAAVSVSREGAVHFVCMGWQRFSSFMAAAKSVYGEAIDIIVWVKSKADHGAFYRNQHEFIGAFRVGNEPHHYIERGRHKRSRSNVWHYTEVDSFGAVSAKPVALVADAIKDCTSKGDVVLDTLSGLGATIMAAERLGRHARAFEVKVRFVDIAIRRWQAATRRQARHAESGLSFDEIAADSVPSR